MAVFRRILLALLTLLLALPAMQANACAPVGEPVEMAESQANLAHDHHAAARNEDSHRGHGPALPEPARTTPHHECIGCVPPIDIRVYRPVGQLEPMTDTAGWSPHPTRLTDWLGTPETPPPRRTI